MVYRSAQQKVDLDKTRPKASKLLLDRRSFLAASAGVTAAIVGLASTHPYGQSVIAQDGSRVFQSSWPYAAPPQGHFNSFVTSGILNPPNIYGDLVWQPMALYYWGPKEWMPVMAESWEFMKIGDAASPAASASPVSTSDPNLSEIAPSKEGDDTLQVRLRRDCVWSDGTPFTTQDVLTTYSLKRLLSDVVWKYLDRVEALNDYTVNFVMKQPSSVVQRYVLRGSIQSTTVYGEWATRAEELFDSGKTVDDPEGRQLLQQFTEYRPDQIVASGPFIIDIPSVTNAQMTLERNESAWNASEVKFDRIVNFNGEGDTIVAVIFSKEVDYATQAFTPAQENQMLQDGFRIVRPPIYSGPALLLNYGKHPELLDKRVRQAMAYAIDRDQNGTVSMGQSGVRSIYMTGLSDNILKDWVTDEDLASFNTYDFDPERAAALLTEAGWTKDGDVWMTPEGKEAVYELLWPAEFTDWSAAGQDATEQLNTFGLGIRPVGVTAQQQPVDVDKGNFDMAIRGWGSSSNPHPHFSYTQAFFTHNTLAINNGGQGTQFPLVQQTDSEGEVDLEALTLDAAKGLNPELQREQVTRIARVFNELLPIIPLWERYGNNSILEGVRSGTWPPDGDPIYQNSLYADGIVTMLMLQGRIEPPS